jgi:outer membrane biosynthesis protein TonB
MTPPATAAATGHRSRKLRRSPAPRSPRRVSGPTRPPRAALAGAGGAAVARPPLSLRLGRRAMRVGDARVLDRLVRGRAWIAIVAAALIGIVFMQVSMLKLNAGVSRAVTAADTLERQNSSLRADISKLDSGERVQDAAANLGMTTRPAGDVRYLDAERTSAARAAASIKPPSPVAPAAPVVQEQAAVTQQQASVTQQQAPVAQQQAPAAQAAATQQQAPVTQQQAPATQQQAPAAQQQAPATQQGAATTNTAPPATGTTNPAGSVAGGATATPGEG